MCLRGTTSAKVFFSSAKIPSASFGSLSLGVARQAAAAAPCHVFLAFHSLFPHFSFSQNLSNAFRLCLSRLPAALSLLVGVALFAVVVGVIMGRERGRRGRGVGNGLSVDIAKLKLTFRERRHNEMRLRERRQGERGGTLFE